MLWTLKICGILTVGFVCQTALEVTLTAQRYPGEESVSGLMGHGTPAVYDAEQRFRRCNAVSKWLVSNVLEMPLHDFGREPLRLIRLDKTDCWPAELIGHSAVPIKTGSERL